MTMLSSCPECYQDFPEHLIQITYVANHPDIENGNYLMYPLCALKIRDSLHRLPKDIPFKGTIAKEHGKEATEYARKNH